MPRRSTTEYRNAVVNPIQQSATYYFQDTAEVIRFHEQQETESLGRYGRYHNPAWTEVEQKLAELEGLSEALLFPSGMSAISTVFLTFLRPGDRILYTKESYRNIPKLCTEILSKLDIEAIPVSAASPEQLLCDVEQYNSDRLRMVFVESPSNPHLYLADLESIKQRLAFHTLLVADNTFATPVNCQPARFGADLVLHSCTKYLSGHGDLLAGCVAGPSDLMDQIRGYRDVMGCIADPHAAWLLNRSLATLKMRMSNYGKNALAVARYLEDHRQVKRVFYTGLSSHPHFHLAEKYLTGHGGVISFELDATREQTSQFIDALKVPYMGTNFGSQYSMVEQCEIFTYYKLTQAERDDLGISGSLVRLSLGFEDVAELIGDLDSALSVAVNQVSA